MGFCLKTPSQDKSLFLQKIKKLHDTIHDGVW
jgi:hypothetical protein